MDGFIDKGESMNAECDASIEGSRSGIRSEASFSLCLPPP